MSPELPSSALVPRGACDVHEFSVVAGLSGSIPQREQGALRWVFSHVWNSLSAPLHGSVAADERKLMGVSAASPMVH
jgi:hypothetical protein